MFPRALGHKAAIHKALLEFCTLKPCLPQTLIFVFHVCYYEELCCHSDTKLQPDAVNVVRAFSKRCEVMCTITKMEVRGGKMDDGCRKHACINTEENLINFEFSASRRCDLCFVVVAVRVGVSSRRGVRFHRETGAGLVFTQRTMLQKHCRSAAVLLSVKQEGAASDQPSRSITQHPKRLCKHCDLHSLTWSSRARCFCRMGNLIHLFHTVSPWMRGNAN